MKPFLKIVGTIHMFGCCVSLGHAFGALVMGEWRESTLYYAAALVFSFVAVKFKNWTIS